MSVFKYLRAEPEDHYFLLVRSRFQYSINISAQFRVQLIPKRYLRLWSRLGGESSLASVLAGSFSCCTFHHHSSPIQCKLVFLV
jgi:hypothetical protein